MLLADYEAKRFYFDDFHLKTASEKQTRLIAGLLKSCVDQRWRQSKVGIFPIYLIYVFNKTIYIDYNFFFF